MPAVLGVIAEDEICKIADTIPAFGGILFTDQPARMPETIIAQQRRCRVNTLQLVDSLPEEVINAYARRYQG